MLAAVNLGITAPGFFHIAACLLEHIGCVIPALEMSPTELALRVLLITGALASFFYLDLVTGQLLERVAYGQRSSPLKGGMTANSCRTLYFTQTPSLAQPDLARPAPP